MDSGIYGNEYAENFLSEKVKTSNKEWKQQQVESQQENKMYNI